MGIKLKNQQEEPALKFDEVFMDKMVIAQSRRTRSNEHPKYCVSIEYRKFAEDAEGNFHYKNKTDTINIPDYVSEMMMQAANGDMDMLNALSAIQSAVAMLIEDKHSLETEVY